jgi:Tfp pilus assembly protein PilO
MKNRVKIYRILTVVVTLLLFYTLVDRVLPEIGNFINLITEYTDLQRELAVDRQWKEKSVNLKREINFLKEKIDTINVHIPSEKEFSKAMDVWDSLLVKNNVFIDQLHRTREDTTDKHYQTIEVQVELSGLYLNVVKFIEDIENCPLIIMVREMKIKLPSLRKKKIEAELILEVLLKKV